MQLMNLCKKNYVLFTNYMFNCFIRNVPTNRTEFLTEKSVGRSDPIFMCSWCGWENPSRGRSAA